MRDKDGKGTMDINRFRETVGYIRAECPNLVINLTTSGALDATDETRTAHLIELKPEMASYDCGSMNWMHNSVFLNTARLPREARQGDDRKWRQA